MKPVEGMRVNFGHLLLEGERTGIIAQADEFNIGGSGVAVDFNADDGPENPPGKIVWGCHYAPEKPESIPGSKWQYCYPILENGKAVIVPVPDAVDKAVKQRAERIRQFFANISGVSA